MSANLVWTSNTQGQIGSGASFSFNGLTVGLHRLPRAVTDSGGLPGSAAVIVTYRHTRCPPQVCGQAQATRGPDVERRLGTIRRCIPYNAKVLTPQRRTTVISTGASITFAATATDTQDGNLGASLVWAFGLYKARALALARPSRPRAWLPERTRVTARVTDSGGIARTRLQSW